MAQTEAGRPIQYVMWEFPEMVHRNLMGHSFSPDTLPMLTVKLENPTGKKLWIAKAAETGRAFRGQSL